MRSVTYRLLFVAALALCSLVSSQPFVRSQQKQPTPTPTPQEQGDIERVTITEVRLPITVLDKNKNPVSGLTRNDFLIYEDKKLQEIKGFSDEKANLPIYV